MELGRGSYFRRAVWQGDILAETQTWSGESHLDIRGKRAQGEETAVAKAWRGDRCWTERVEAASLERIGRGRVGGARQRNGSDRGLITASMWACGGLGIRF